jgi:hypothetical protein
LLITTDLTERQQFLDRMGRGLPDKGVEIHPDKTNVSNNANTAEWFPWCGFVFQTTTGHVKLDYTRFYDGGQVAGSLTVDYQRPGDHLRGQLLTFCRPRCLPLLFDGAINSPSMRRYNFYQLIAFAAVKTMHYLAGSSWRFTNESFLATAIEDTIRFAYRLIQSRLRKALNVPVPFLGVLPATWLGRKAWNDVARWSAGGGGGGRHSVVVVTLELPILPSREQRSHLECVAAQAWNELDVDRLLTAKKR